MTESDLDQKPKGSEVATSHVAHSNAVAELANFDKEGKADLTKRTELTEKERVTGSRKVKLSRM